MHLERPKKHFPAILEKTIGYVRSFPRPVWLLVGATCVESMGRFMVVPFLSLYMSGAGVSLGTLGLVLGAAPLANIVFGAWGGHLSDRWGRKPVQIMGVCISGLSMFGFAFAGPNPAVLALLNFLNGMTRTFYRPATNAALSDHCPAERRSEAFALNRISLNAAFGLGPILGVAIFHSSPQAGFVIGGSLNLAVGLFLALAVPESAPARLSAQLAKAKNLAYASGAPEIGAQAKDMPEGCNALLATQQLPAWKELLRDGGFWIWTAGMTLIWGAYDLIQSFLPLHFRDSGIPLEAYSAVLATNAFVCVFFQLPFSRVLRVSNIGFSVGFSKILFVAGFVGFAFLRSPALLVLAMFILAIGEVWGSAVQTRYIPEHARPSLLGRYMGLSMVSELGRAIVAPTAGFLMQALGGSSVFMMAAGLSLAGGVLLYISGKAQDGRTGR